jgi:hypothetical protein
MQSARRPPTLAPRPAPQPHYGQPISQCELLLNRAKEGGAKR